MKILHIDTGRELRGGQHQLLLLIAGLAKRGHEQVLLARGPTLDRFPGREASLLNLRNAARDADLIHAHDGRGHTLAAVASAGKPLIVSRRVAFPVREGFFSRRKYARADHYIAISNHVRGKLLEAGIDGARVSVVYDGVALDESEPAGGSREPHVLAPQINDPLKGAELLRAACGKAGVELKFSANLPHDLPRAAALVYLSENEGLGSAILLAMARKTPVIASRVGGIPELVEHEVTGLLVENRIDDVVAALRRAAAEPALFQQCAERAYKKVVECFADDIMTERTEQIYRAVLDRRPPP
jgi:glycosyltransferase involved in cell wall biosynthesis